MSASSDRAARPGELTADELLSTTRAVRKRLDLDRPVPRDVLLECVELAVQAPSGSNSQRWHWVFVNDAAKRAKLAELYNRVFKRAYSPEALGQMDEAGQRVWSSAQYLAEHLHEVPVLLVPCQWTRPADGAASQAAYWGSILPAVWSFMLAARSRGLGTAWTTMHLTYEEEAADVLGIPFARCAQAGLFPVAYTVGTEFKPGPRRPLDELVHWNEW
ncbi:MAG TPA: nitroreductase family protein [Acidimicrobiales bacterium]|nr:nitroreductase family protein [Acidimicrobiales bacterium]